MPQLIAMVIVVVAAMIYMFQTFGGTGDKIEGIAQKTSIITEISNIKNGLQLATRAGDMHVTTQSVSDGNGGTTTTTTKTTLKELAVAGYFAEQINNELKDNTGTTNGLVGSVNTYGAISFGGETNPGMLLTLVLPSSTGVATARPGIFVDLTTGSLKANAGFLEKQLLTDLSAVASIDTHATAATYNTLSADGTITAPTTGTTGTTDVDGKFVIYFKDIQAGTIN